MRFPLSVARRRAVIGGFALAGLLLVVAQGRAAAPIEKRLPDSTIGFAKVQNAVAFRAAHGQSQLGQLLDDPGIKAWKDDILERLEEAGKEIKADLGVNPRELFALVEGPAAIALIVNEESEPSLLLAADVGKNTAAMNDVLSRVTTRAERDGDKVSTESFHGVTIHVMQDGQPAKDADKAKDKDRKKAKDKDDEEEDDEAENWPETIVWSCQGSVFWFGTNVATIKDLIAHEEGRDNALAASSGYTEAVKTLGADAPALWYVDLRKIAELLSKDLDAYKESDADHAKWVREFQTVAQQSGLGGLGAVVGSFVPYPGAGNVDSITRTMILLQGPAQGLLKAFRAPRVPLQPEPWVPASVASYQSFSWDLDEAFSVLSELTNRNVPGLLDAIEKELAGPEGGRPLKFKQDIFDPLGDRITIISDFKQPITENSKPIHLTINLDHAYPRRISRSARVTTRGSSWPSPWKTPRPSRTRSTNCSPWPEPIPSSASSREQPFTTSSSRRFRSLTIPRVGRSEAPSRSSRARSAWPSPRTPCSSLESQPCSRRSSAAAAPPWSTATPTARSPERRPTASAASATSAPTSRLGSPTHCSRTACSRPACTGWRSASAPTSPAREPRRLEGVPCILGLHPPPGAGGSLHRVVGGSSDHHELLAPQGEALRQANRLSRRPFRIVSQSRDSAWNSPASAGS